MVIFNTKNNNIIYTNCRGFKSVSMTTATYLDIKMNNCPFKLILEIKTNGSFKI